MRGPNAVRSRQAIGDAEAVLDADLLIVVRESRHPPGERASFLPLAGPVLVRNDPRGAWRLYLRAGSGPEVRLSRTLSF